VNRNILTVPIHKVAPGSDVPAQISLKQDLVAVEEPLQIRIDDRDFAITMRTPGQDRELTAGFLFTEGIVQNPSQIANIAADDKGTVTVHLAEGVKVSFADRNFYVTSSCGVCGKASIDGLRNAGCPTLPRGTPHMDSALIPELPGKLRAAQPVFSHTGGLHAAGLFDTSGNLIAVREDVGRHNAVDKLIGAAFFDGQIPLHNFVLMLSGRISFELVQKALMAGIPIVAAVGAPSSLAIETALHFGLTLIGFVRGQTYNVYSAHHRLLAKGGQTSLSPAENT
jgi:FdhD protein